VECDVVGLYQQRTVLIVIILVDFGLCADVSSGPVVKMLGSTFWIAPEMIKKIPHTVFCDIWSLGVLVLEMILMGLPCGSSSLLCMFMAGTRGLQEEIPAQTSKDAQDFLKLCLQTNPSRRPTANQLLQHRWLLQDGIETGISDIFRSIFLATTLSAMV